MKNDKNLWVLVFVCVINSMGFGIIVPVLYSYGKKVWRYRRGAGFA